MTNFEQSKVVSRDALRARGVQNYQYYTDNSAFGHSLEEPGNEFDYFVIPSRGANREFTTVSDLAVEILRANPGLKDAGGQNYTVESLTRWIQLHGNNGGPLYDQSGVLCDGTRVMNRQALIHPGQVVRIPEITNPVTLAATRPIQECVEPGVSIEQAEALLAPAAPEATVTPGRDIRPTTWDPQAAGVSETNGLLPYFGPNGAPVIQRRGGMDNLILWRADPADRAAATGGTGYSPSDGTESGVNRDPDGRAGRTRVVPSGVGEELYSLEAAGNRRRNHAIIAPRVRADGTAEGAVYARTIDIDIVRNPLYRSFFQTSINLPLFNQTAIATFRDVLSTREGISAYRDLAQTFDYMNVLQERLPANLRFGQPAAAAGSAAPLTPDQEAASRSYFNMLMQNLANPIVWDGQGREGLPTWDQMRNEAEAFISRLPENSPVRAELTGHFEAFGLQRGEGYIQRDPNEFLRRVQARNYRFENAYLPFVDERARQPHVQSGLGAEDIVRGRGVASGDNIRITQNGNSFSVAVDPNANPRILAAVAADEVAFRRGLQRAVNRALEDGRADEADVRAASERYIENFVYNYERRQPGYDRAARELQVTRELLTAEANVRDPNNWQRGDGSTSLRGSRPNEQLDAMGVTRVTRPLVEDQAAMDPDSARGLMSEAFRNEENTRATLLALSEVPGGLESVFRLGQIGTAGNDAQARTWAGTEYESRDALARDLRTIARGLGVDKDHFVTNGREFFDFIPNLFGAHPETRRDSNDNREELYRQRAQDVIRSGNPPEVYQALMRFAQRAGSNAGNVNTSADPAVVATVATYLTPNQHADDAARGALRPSYTAWSDTIARNSEGRYADGAAVRRAAENQSSIEANNFAGAALVQRGELLEGQARGEIVAPATGITRPQAEAAVNGAPVARGAVSDVAVKTTESRGLFDEAGRNAGGILTAIARNDDKELARVVVQTLYDQQPALRAVIGARPADADAAIAALTRIAGNEIQSGQLVDAIAQHDLLIDVPNRTGGGNTRMSLAQYITMHLNTDAETDALAAATTQGREAIIALQQAMGARASTTYAGGVAPRDGASGTVFLTQETNVTLPPGFDAARFRLTTDFQAGRTTLASPGVQDAVAERIAAQFNNLAAGSSDSNVGRADYNRALANRLANAAPGQVIDAVRDVLGGTAGTPALRDSLNSFLSTFAEGGDAHARLAAAFRNPDPAEVQRLLSALAATPEGSEAMNSFNRSLIAQNNDFNALLSERMRGASSELGNAQNINRLLSGIAEPARSRLAQSLLSLNSGNLGTQGIQDLDAQVQGLLSYRDPVTEPLITLSILALTMGGGGGGATLGGTGLPVPGKFPVIPGI